MLQHYQYLFKIIPPLPLNVNRYTGVVEVEANCLLDMIVQQIIPAVKEADFADKLFELEACVASLKAGLTGIHKAEDDKQKAALARQLRLETMIQVRETCDSAEAIVPAHLWSLATYKELLFLDQHLE